MKVDMDEHGFVSQTAAAAVYRVSQQYVNRLARDGKVLTKANGAVRASDVLDCVIESDARRQMSRAEFATWRENFRTHRRIEHLESDLERLLWKFPKIAERLLGPERIKQLTEYFSEGQEQA